MGKSATGALVQDSLATYLEGVLDPATGTFYFRRAVNLHTSANGDYADSTSVLYGPDGNVLLPAAAALADATANPTTSMVGNCLLRYNGTTWDREYNNIAYTLLTSAARTITTATSVQTNFNNRGVLVTANVTAVSGSSPTLAIHIQGQDSVSSTNYDILVGATINATGIYSYEVYPGIVPASSGASLTAAAGVALPRSWLVNCAIGGSTPSFTFSLGAALIN